MKQARIEVNCPLTDEQVTIDVEAKLVDFGIGQYEFWGSSGTDVQLGWEINEISISDSSKVKLDEFSQQQIKEWFDSDSLALQVDEKFMELFTDEVW
jgi:hypothetical protein